MNPTPNSKEILQGSPDEKITLRSVEELKKQLWINNIPDEYKDYFEKPLETTKAELLELRKKYLTSQPNDETIKSFLEAKRNAIIEKAKSWLDEVKKVAWNLKKSMEFEAKKIAEWQKQWKEADSLIDNAFESTKKTAEKLWDSEVVTKTKETLEQAATKTKETTKKGVEAIKKSKWFIDFINWLEKLKEQGWLWGFFATLILFILWVFGFTKEKLKKKAEEKAKEVLNWKEAEKVKKEVVYRIKIDLLKSDKLNPRIREKLEAVINDPNIISPENLVKLRDRLKQNHKLSLSDLREILGEKWFQKLQNEVFDEETKNILKAQAEKKIVDTIYEKYNLDLHKDKRKQLEQLVWKYINVDNFFELDEKLKTDGVNLADILWIAFSQWFSIALFMIEAVWKWIIGPSKLIIYAGKQWAETISLWLAWLWIKSDITYDKFKEEIGKMNSVERWLLLWTLYRHTWFLSNILWEIAWTSSRLLIEWISSTPVSSFWAWWSAFWKDINKKIKVFTKLESIFWKSAWAETIKNALGQIKTLKTNNEIIKLLNQSNNDVNTFKKLLNWLDITKYDEHIINIVKDTNIKDFAKFREEISTKITTLKNTWISRNLKNILSQLHFPIEKFEYEFFQNTDNILKYQREAIKTWTLAKAWKFFTKLWEIQWYSNLSRDLEKLHFEGLSKAQALNKMQALKKLFLDFPEFSRSFFWTLPEIAFFGLAISWKKEDESWIDAMIDTMWYMTPVIGPIRMVFFDAKAKFEKWKLEWYDMAEAWVWGVLLWIDATYIWKIVMSWGSWTEKLIKIWSHIAKPITSPYKFWRDTYKMWKNLYDVIKAEWKINWWKLWKKSLETLKKWAKSKKGLALAAIAILWYVWYELTKEDISDEYKELMDKWIIDNKWNIKNYKKLKEEFDKMDLDEKESAIEIIFLMASVPTSWLEFKIKWNKLNIISHDKTIRWDWILKDSEWKILKTLDSIWFNYNNINLINAEPEENLDKS